MDLDKDEYKFTKAIRYKDAFETRIYLGSDNDTPTNLYIIEDDRIHLTKIDKKEDAKNLKIGKWLDPKDKVDFDKSNIITLIFASPKQIDCLIDCLKKLKTRFKKETL